MSETILNIYLVIENESVIAFRGKAYEIEGTDNDKIKYLKERAKLDFDSSKNFDAPTDKRGEFMKYKNFAKLEEQGMHYQLFESIFSQFEVPQNPLICVTPVVEGEIKAD